MSRRDSEWLRRLEKIDGVTVEIGGRNHLKVSYQGQFVVTLTQTSRDIGRRRQNELSMLRKAGIPL